MKEKKKRIPSPKQLAALLRGREKLAEKRCAKTKQSELPKVKRVGGRRWWPVYAGVGLFIITALIAKLYLDSNNNMILAVLFVMSGTGGFLFIYQGLKRRDEGYVFVKPGGEKVTINANCLNIYYRKNEDGDIECDYIAFEEMIPPDKYDAMTDILPGQVRGEIVSKMPQRCLNDGKFYYVHIFDPNKDKYLPFKLPDTQYFDPREMVNPVTMPAVKRELKPIPTLGEKLRPALLLIGIAILSVLFIATGGPPPD